ncbi:hypothetical protein GCM10007276_27590 [Agaricicola taiwanensis]|uniref:Polysaccharide pyruvyl transferase domain-containing protein n=1 Tax=Agaricicola taiwanensis TaxID=591372 RepID=A0A8J2YKB3_9RHOB|nr:polysaccharide pyruvyl transferase family protein [Agaricicola taiwanensis]GGE48900.1 hypothetical protein GCM10007276_27590 [Agaricicola taiwanensis]
MNIEILGVDPANRGAGLMFEAIRQQFDARYGDVNYAMSIDVRPQERLKLGAWGVLPRAMNSKRNMALRYGGERVPRSILHRLGILAERDIDIVLDASGFAYGDFWGAQKMASRMADHIASWKRAGKSVILLPQAWGAFEKPGFAPLLRRIFDKADLVFARDETSLAYLKGVVGDPPNLHLAPDFTNLLKPDLPSRLQQHAGATLVVPNAKVIQSKGEAIREQYLDFLQKVVAAAVAHGHRPAFLIHEGRGDEALAEEVNNRRNSPVDVIAGLDPLETKAVISHADAITSSRFHGLVSALSAGVPSLACGWSHKYQELLKDYGCPEFVIDMSAETDIDSRITSFFETALTAGARSRLKAASEHQRALSRAMWDKVFGVIEKRAAA